MKIIKLFLLAFLPIMLSCSQSGELETLPSVATMVSTNATYSAKYGDVDPSNLENPYDAVGAINNSIFLQSSSVTWRDSSIAAVIDGVQNFANNSIYFQQLSSYPYVFVDTERVNRLLVSNDSLLSNSLKIAVGDIDLRISFEQFFNQIMSENANDVSYSLIYDEIASYEKSIINNVSASSSDKQALLSATSILRYKIKRLKKRPKKNTDPDWDLMITTMGATLEGGKEHLQEAIILSLISELAKSQ